ncbi:very long chain fatty acid elongase 7 [Bacillus rossius redtenbacheri]|uniref:very long chain fatty acid elongase 7 n=1 Tax=Bacillus rossius redtenbacheri TaxID=93214 RepID=UPI002FDDEDF5
MAVYNKTTSSYWDYLFVDLADPRTNDWFLIRSPLPGLAIIASYIYFVVSLGPRFMKDRKPFKITKILIVYNFLQVVVSIYLFCEGLDGAWLTKYNWKCEPVDFSTSPEAIRVAQGVYVYFIAKLTELLDTVFFVLRKKDSQITFLHMYHHTVMPLISWGATKYYPGGHGTFIGVINSFVHIIMYFYYLMAAMGPQYHKYLWWKKYITTLQMTQFCIAFLHSSQLVLYDCGFPRWSVFFTLPNAIFFYYLFSDFYCREYEKPRTKKDIALSRRSS